MKKVFVVILNYKGEADTKELLISLRKVKKENFDLDIVIIDNYPQDPIKLGPEYKDLNLHVIYNKENLGFSGGNNVGIKYSQDAGADYIIILNNDTLVDPLFIKELIRVVEEDEQIGIAVPKIYFAKGYEFHKDRYKENELGKVIWYAGGSIDWDNIIGVHRGVDEIDRGQFDRAEETTLATGCCLLIKKEVLEKVRGYEDEYFLYYEDADLSFRVKRKGFRLVYVPTAIIWHKNAQSTEGSGSALQDYFITRNRLLFGLKYAPFKSKVALIRESLFLIFGGRVWQKRGVIDFYLKRFGKGSYPL